MRAQVLKAFGGPENLELCDIPRPQVKPGTVLIKVLRPPSTLSVSRSARACAELPGVLGCDVAGVVEER